MSKKRFLPLWRRRQRIKELSFVPSIQSLENRFMLTVNPPVVTNDSYTAVHDRALIATTTSSGVLPTTPTRIVLN